MPTPGSSDCHPPTSVADAKLRRQQQRIEMDAALNAPARSHRAHSRGKKLPIDWNISEQQAELETRAPAAEVRVNTFYQHDPAGVPTLSRPMSGHSEQAVGTDMGRRDSCPSYQMFQRGHSRKQEELTPVEGKPEEEQKTVEATFDKREIYQVFACELPGLEFLHANPGNKHGQLQFVQHPNGDVSAHMWSVERYIWENIGSFSNIRKKIEGQISNDRLTGETALQALQRNTLAYFRTVAKQKEQTVMGFQFGQAQIQTLLPQSKEQASWSRVKKDDEASHTTGSSRVTSNSTVVIQAATHGNCTAPSPQTSGLDHFQTPDARQDEKSLEAAQESAHQLRVKDDDPFTSARFHSSFYSQPGAAHAIASESIPSHGESCSTAAQATPASSKSVVVALPLLPSGNDNAAHLNSVSRPRAVPILSGGIPGLLPDPSLRGKSSKQRNERQEHSLSNAGTPSRAKPATPLLSREAMRKQLFKLGAAAKERSLSQANIRTVLYDPFQSQSVKKDESESDDWSVAKVGISDLDVSPTLSRRHPIIHDTPSLKVSKPNSNSVLHGLEDSKSTLPGCLEATLQRQCSIGDSVPDTGEEYNKTMVLAGGSTSMANPPTSNTVSDRTWKQELNDWWYSGNKIARQEEFYQSIVALSKNSAPCTPSRKKLTTSSSRPRQIGALAGASAGIPSVAPAKDTTPPFNETMTRILIPVYENLASYVQGPLENRRDYWCNWTQPPGYAIDHSLNGNNSFFEEAWGTPPARIGRDPRYARVPGDVRFGGMSPSYSSGGVINNSPAAATPRPAVLSGGIPGLGGGRYWFGNSAAGERY